MAKRKRRRNPDMTTWLILGGAAAAGYWYYTKSKKPAVAATPAGPVVVPAPSPTSTLIGAVTDGINKLFDAFGGGSSPAPTPVQATAAEIKAKLVVGQIGPGNSMIVSKANGIYTDKRGTCWTIGKATGLAQPVDCRAKQLEGLGSLGSLGSCGLGSLGDC